MVSFREKNCEKILLDGPHRKVSKKVFDSLGPFEQAIFKINGVLESAG